MKLIALSDLHGNLIKIKERSDIVVIAGDWSPEYIQHDYYSMMKWISDKFAPWMKSLPTKKVIFISGNHDIICTYSMFELSLNEILNRLKISNKVHYLNHSSIKLFGYKFYGLPDTEKLSPKWAFAHSSEIDYTFDEDTEVLITHQPPSCDRVGITEFNEDFGSDSLAKSIHDSKIICNICGHIHTGEHGDHYLTNSNGDPALVINASILDEDYCHRFNYSVINFKDR